MSSFLSNSRGDFRATNGRNPGPPHIAYPPPSSQPNSNRVFFIPDYIIGGSSRRPRQSASVPQLPMASSTSLHHTNGQTTEANMSYSSEQSSSSRLASSPSHTQLSKFKLRFPYSSARQRLNKFINKNLIPSFLYNSDTASTSSSSSSSSRKKASLKNASVPSSVINIESSEASTSSSRHVKLGAPSYSTPNLNSLQPPVLSVPVETASVSSLRANRSRQGSVSTTHTTNENSGNTADAYLGIQSSAAPDNGSVYGLTVLDTFSSTNSYNSSLSSASNYYAQQYHLNHHLQQQAKQSNTLMDDSESGVAFLNEDFQGIKPALPAKVDFVRLLPQEIVDQVFSSLDIKSLASCTLVCQSWKNAANSDVVWRQQFFKNKYWDTVQDFLPKEDESEVSWKLVYQTRYRLEERWKSGNVEAKALKGHSDSVYCVHYNDDIIVTGSRDQTIKVWDARSGALLKTLGKTAPEPVDEVVAEPGNGPANPQFTFGATTAFLTPSANSLPTPSTSAGLTDQIMHTKSVLCLHFDNSLMISGSSDSTIILWSLPGFTPLRKIQQHTAGVLDVVMSDEYICSCSRDSSICVWTRPQPVNGEYDTSIDVKLIRVLRGHRGPVNSVQMRGDFIFSAGGDALVKMWSISSGTCLRNFAGHFRGLACIQLSQDGKTIVSGSNDMQIRVWDVDSCRCLHVLEGHTALVRSLDLSSGKIISGSYDQTLKIWDLATGELISDLDTYFGSWIFSAKADHKRIICTSFGSKPVILDYTAGLDKRCLEFLSA